MVLVPFSTNFLITSLTRFSAVEPTDFNLCIRMHQKPCRLGQTSFASYTLVTLLLHSFACAIVIMDMFIFKGSLSKMPSIVAATTSVVAGSVSMEVTQKGAQ